MTAPKSPTTLRTARNIALEKGTAKGGFDGSLNNSPPPEPKYEDNGVPPDPSGGSPINVDNPFKG